MAQTLEFPWNGVTLEGGWPNVTAPTTTANPFYFWHTRNIKRVRIYLDPRIVMPPPATTIPGGVQTSLTAIANAAVATVGATTLATKIEWALLSSTEPTSTTASRRPWVSWLENYWEKVDDLLGSHAATWGYVLLTSPRVFDLAAANSDPDSSMTVYTDMSWPTTEDPALNAGPWLEIITRETVEHLRAAGATKPIIIPTVYHPYTANPSKVAHPGGPWIDDPDVWYEATVTPMGSDGFNVTKQYSGYVTDATTIDFTYRPSWYESAYFTSSPGSTSIIDALDLNPTEQLEIDPETQGGLLSLPVTDLTATALNQGALLEWTPPEFFGDGEFASYQVEITETNNPGGGFVSFNTTSSTINAGPVVNDIEYSVSVYVRTTEGLSVPAFASFTPLSTLADPVGGWYDETPENPSTPPIIYPQPAFFAFPEERNFKPSNWLKTPAEVEEGY